MQLLLSPLVLPFILPKVINGVRAWKEAKSNGPTQPSQSSPPIPSSNSPSRLLLLSLALSLSFFSVAFAPPNIFLSLSPPRTMLETIPVLRQSLDIRTSTEILASRWERQSGELAVDQLNLLARLQTLDARIAYVTHGAAPLLHCNWCKNPSSLDGGHHMDYLLYNSPSFAMAYLIILSLLGVMTGGNYRRWRTLLFWGVGGAAAVESWYRITWDTTSGREIVMVRC